MSRLFPFSLLSDRLKVIAHFELRRHLRSFRFLVSSGLLTILVALAVWVGLADYRLRVETSYEEKIQEQDSSLILGNVYSSLQPIITKTPNPLAIFERGVEGQEGTDIRITVVEVPVQATGQNRGNPYLARLVGLDVTTVIKLVLGLGALLLTFDSMVGDRSRLRAQALLAHGANPSEVLIGKVLAVLGALIVSLTAALGPPVVTLFALGVFSPEMGEIARLAGVLSAYLAYGLTMALVGLGISLRSSSVARSLVYATLTWLILVILLPLSLTAGVTAYADLQLNPSAVELEVEGLERKKEDHLLDLKAMDLIRVTPSGHISVSYTFGDHGAFLHRFGSSRFNDSLASYYADEVRLGRLYAERIYGLRQRAKLEAQRWLRPLGWAAALLPGQLLDLTASTMAGTTSADHDRFIESAQMYRQSFLAYLELKGAVGSWRWFTDDPEGGSPWTTFFGVEPDDVTSENIAPAIERWQDEQVQVKVAESIKAREGDDPRFDVSDLPAFNPAAGSPGRPLMAASASLIMVGILWLLVLAAAGRSSVLLPSLQERGVQSDLFAEASSSIIQRWRKGLLGGSRLWDPSIFRAEFVGIVRHLRWRAAALLVMVMMMAGASIFASRHEAVMADREKALAAYEAELEGKNLSDLLRVNHLVSRPAWSLGFLIDGEERVRPSSYLLPLTTWVRSDLKIPTIDLQRLSSVPSPDWSFVLRVVLSLSAFFIGYDSLSGRRLGRCQVQLACGTPLLRIAAAKAAALWTALALPFLGGSFLGLLVLGFHGHGLPTGENLLKLMVFLLIGLWALVFYVLATLIVSAWLGSGEKALVTLILLWISAVSVIPSAAGILVMRLEPLPPDWKVQANLNLIRMEAQSKEGANTFRRLEWARADDFAGEKKAAEIHRQRRADQERLGRLFIERQLAQAELAGFLASLSPMSLLQNGLQNLLGSGIYRQYAFIDQFYQFDQSLKTWALQLDAKDPESPHIFFFPRYFSTQPVDPENVPRFEHRDPTLAEGIRGGALPLVLFSLLTFALAAFLPWILEHRLANEKGQLK